MRQAVSTAAAIGDDRLQRGHAVPDSFTHGTSEQRVRWLTTGLREGNVQSQWDTFANQPVRRQPARPRQLAGLLQLVARQLPAQGALGFDGLESITGRRRCGIDRSSGVHPLVERCLPDIKNARTDPGVFTAKPGPGRGGNHAMAAGNPEF